MSVKKYKISMIDSQTAKSFIIKNHYSKKCPNGFYYIGLFDDLDLIGVAVYGQVIGRRQAKYWYPDNPDKLIELRRLACVDNTLKNTESYFISQTIKWLEHNTDYECIISLADPVYSHTGTIYKASNFKFCGTTLKCGHPVFVIDGIECHPKTLYNQHGTSSVETIKHIYGNRLVLRNRLNKLVYMYKLKSKLTHKKIQAKLF